MTARASSFTRGQALVEYLLALLVLAMLIGFGVGGEGSVIDTLLDAVRTAFERQSGFISLPL